MNKKQTLEYFVNTLDTIENLTSRERYNDSKGVYVYNVKLYSNFINYTEIANYFNLVICDTKQFKEFINDYFEKKQNKHIEWYFELVNFEAESNDDYILWLLKEKFPNEQFTTDFVGRSGGWYEITNHYLDDLYNDIMYYYRAIENGKFTSYKSDINYTIKQCREFEKINDYMNNELKSIIDNLVKNVNTQVIINYLLNDDDFEQTCNKLQTQLEITD